MKILKRTAAFMAKEHSMYKALVYDGKAELIYDTKDEKTYLIKNGTVSFFYDKDGYVRGMYKVENEFETNYELKPSKA